MPDDDTAIWSDLRAAMPSAVQWACLDHASVAPLSGPAYQALTAWAADLVQNGAANWPRWAARLEQIRRCGARLIGAEAAEMALVRSTTEGINLVAEGFPWRDGDNVVTLADEFPSNLYPWMHLAGRGVETRRVDVAPGQDPLDALARACDGRTRIVSVSWVGYVSGWRHDLDKLAQMVHDRGALLFLDAIQGLGVFPIDVRRTPIDFLAADGHKWLLGPEGAGLFFLRQEHLDLLRPVGVGWNSVRQSVDFSRIELTFKSSAGRYEGGTYNMGGFMALGASLDLLSRHPTADLARRVLATTDELCARLETLGATIVSDRTPEHASGIVSFDLPGRDPQQARTQCRQRRVLLSCRGGHLRASPHAYNNSYDLDCLLQAIQAPA